MKHIFLLFALVSFSVMITAQAQPAADPARAVPATTPLYIQLRADDAAKSAYQTLFHAFAWAGDQPLPPQMDVIADALNPALDVTFAPVDVRTDVLPWLGDSVGMAIFTGIAAAPQEQPPTDYALVLPVADPAGAQAFVQRVAGEAVTQIGGIDVYAVELSYLAVSPETIWLGSPEGVTRTLNELAGGSLADNEAYNRVTSQLPTDALIAGYVSGEWIRVQAAPFDQPLFPGFASLDTLYEVALRLHPADSEMETALLQRPPFTGAGFALEYADGQLNVTAAALLDASYAAPALASATAGAALLDYVPANSVLVFNSYDPSMLAVPYAGVFVTAPVVSTRFEDIVSMLQDPAAPTATPLPTPTPVPPPSADELITQAQPFIQQVEALLGMSLADLYRLINGEYAFAIFPVGESAQPGFALWLHSSEDQRLLGTAGQLRGLLGLASLPNTNGAQIETSIIGDVEVHYMSIPNSSERIAYGLIRQGVMFITTESSLNAVLAAANFGLTPARFPVDVYQSFGAGQEAALYADLSGYTALTAGTNNVTPVPPVSRVIAALDAAENGLFRLRASLTLAQR